MSKKITLIALLGALTLPTVAMAESPRYIPVPTQGKFSPPKVELFATVTGKWVLDPRRCSDVREDMHDARYSNGRRNRGADAQDRRVADCPASAYDFIVDAGQGPRYPVQLMPGRISHEYRGRPMYVNGGRIGPQGKPMGNRRYDQPDYYGQRRPQQPDYRRPSDDGFQPSFKEAPAYQQPTYQTAPTYQSAPTYQTTPTYQSAPTYQSTPTYQVAPDSTVQNGQQIYTSPAPTYSDPAPAPSQPSNYRVENGVIIFE